jgi:hypothetical protein
VCAKKNCSLLNMLEISSQARSSPRLCVCSYGSRSARTVTTSRRRHSYPLFTRPVNCVVCLRTHTRLHTYTHRHTHTQKYTHTHTRTHTCTQTHTRAHAHIRMHIHTHAHTTHIYTLTHTYTGFTALFLAITLVQCCYSPGPVISYAFGSWQKTRLVPITSLTQIHYRSQLCHSQRSLRFRRRGLGSYRILTTKRAASGID